jgi:hypothetical protein|tara:strand:- start:1035 stop:1670 length:636 start_codon:yes stop_codon:yes gene_type:complete
MVPINLLTSAGLNIASGIIGSQRRKREQRAAQAEFDASMAEFRNQDVSNPYANMENVYEDLTVNTQAADFAANQQAQGMANIMSNMSAAAGGSGIAALAQSLANQQSVNAQQASADIARQEAGNQMAQRQMAGQLQSMERQGDLISRNMKRDQIGTELTMAAGRKQAADQARQEATQRLIGGIGQGIVGGVQTAAAFKGDDETLNALAGRI